jgi:hypothetical protein
LPLLVLGVKNELVLLAVGEVNLAATRLDASAFATSQPASHDLDDLRAADDHASDLTDVTTRS